MSTSLGGPGEMHWGTGTVVSPHVVLTAAHVVAMGVADQNARFNVFVGADRGRTGGDPSSWSSIREVHVHPSFDLTHPASAHDFAVLILDSPTTILPVPLNRSPVDASWVGRPIRFVGYGVTSSTDTTAASGGLLRREGASTIGSFNSGSLFSAPGGSQQPCSGDSGGPGFVSIAAVEVLAGVVSYGDVSCVGTSLSRVDESASFVDHWITLFDSASDAGNAVEASSGVDSDDGSDETATSVVDAADVQTQPRSDVADDAEGWGPKPADALNRGARCSIGRPIDNRPSSFAVVVMFGIAVGLRRRRRRIQPGVRPTFRPNRQRR